MLSAFLGECRKRNPCPQGRNAVAGSDGLLDRRLQRHVDPLPLAEPDRELEIRQAELALGFRVEVGATLEEVRRDVELDRQAA